MKVIALAAALAASAVALPASAQNWWDPMTLLHSSYAEIEGGGDFQGRTDAHIAATGLGTTSQSARLDDDIFGGALVGYNLTPVIALEAEGVYSRTHFAYQSNNPVFGQNGAIRTYGGLGNVKLSSPYSAHMMSFTITPYVAAGIGYGDVQYTGRTGIYGYRAYEDGFIWQGKAGVEFKAGRHLALDIAYRFLQAPDYTTPGAYHDAGYSALARSHIQAATLGLKYYF